MEDSLKAALANPIVLRCIFSNLDLSDLKQCRLVDKFWELEVGSYIREYRKCFAKISKETPCSDLLALNKLISNAIFLPIVNGLPIIPCGRPVPYLSLTYKGFDEILRKISLKHLEIPWMEPVGRSKCPSVQFYAEVVREKLSGIETLTFSHFSAEQQQYFGKEWNTMLPKLKVLDLGTVYTSDSDEFASAKPFLITILNAAPNLVTIKANSITAKSLDIIPSERWHLLDSFKLSISTYAEAKNCLELVQARPALSKLSVRAPFDPERLKKVLIVAERLLTSSCKALKQLEMGHLNFPFTFLNCPPLFNLKKLTISTEFESEQQYEQFTASQLLAVLRSIDYPTLLPSLSTVHVDTEEMGKFPEEEPNPWIPINAQAPIKTRPAVTVRHLKVTGDFSHLKVQELVEVFPRLTSLRISPVLNEKPAIPYGDIWTCWPALECLKVYEGVDAFRKNLDSEFLGIYPEEVELLRQLGDEALEKIHIVPVRPSILTMMRLKELEITLDGYGAEKGLAENHVFLSKVTGILALRKMARRGVKVRLVGLYDNMASRLYHLREFATVSHMMLHDAVIYV